MTINNFCQYPVTTNTQGENKKAIFTSKRRNTSDILAETLKGLTLDSTINDSAYYNSDEYHAEGNPKSNPLAATRTSDRKKIIVTDTDTTNINSLKTFLINRTLPMIIPPIDPLIADGIAASKGTTYARQTTYLKVIVTYTARSGVRVFRNPADVNRTDTYRTIPQDGNTSISYPRLNLPVLVVDGTTVINRRWCNNY